MGKTAVMQASGWRFESWSRRIFCEKKIRVWLVRFEPTKTSGATKPGGCVTYNVSENSRRC